MLSRCFLDFSVIVGAFVIGLSQISFFFSLFIETKFWMMSCFMHICFIMFTITFTGFAGRFPMKVAG